MGSDYLKPDRVAELLNVTRRDVYNRIARKEIRAVDLNAGTGRRPLWRVPLTEVMRVLQVEEPKSVQGS